MLSSKHADGMGYEWGYITWLVVAAYTYEKSWTSSQSG